MKYLILAILVVLIAFYLGSQRRVYDRTQVEKRYQETKRELDRLFKERARKEQAQRLLLDEQARKKELVAKVSGLSGSAVEVVEEIKRVFSPEGEATVQRALAISFCESGYRPNAQSHTGDSGPMQINQVHIKRFGNKFQTDWKENIQVGYKIYKEQGFGPWVCARKLGLVN